MLRRSRLLLAALVLSSRAAFASNVTEVPDVGSEQTGRGGAWVARATDPLAISINPAGLAGQASRLTVQANLVVHHTCFSRLRAASDTSIDPLADSSGRFPRVCSDIEPAVVPQLAATWRLDDRLGLGFAVVTPSAAGARNWPEFVSDATGPKAAPQRYLMTRQSGIIVFPTIGIGYEVVDNLRLGASFGWGLAKLKSTSATVALNSSGQTADNDVRANLQVSDAFVPRIGLGGIYSAAPNVDIAAFYQWTDAIRASGDVGTATSYYTPAVARGDESRVGYADTIFGDCGTGRAEDAGKCGSGDNARLRLAVPMEAKLGVRFHQARVSSPPRRRERDPLANDLFDAEVNLTWANNSAIEALEVRFPSGASGAGRLPVAGINSEIPPNADQARMYRDVIGLRVGGDYNVLPDRLALRAGAYVESAAGRPQYQHVDFAAGARLGFALGGTYRIRFGADPARTDALEIMVGYGHTFVADASRDDPNATGIGAVAGSGCPEGTTVTGPRTCSGGAERFRTRWPVNLGTITNALNVINVGVAYRF